MITTPTVLIVGAGGSVPYGYPVGSELRKQIIEHATNLKYYVAQKILGECSSATESRSTREAEAQIKEFSDTFRQSRMYSIDAFLERNPRFLDIGKAAIAERLLKCQNVNNFNQDDDWYRYLFNRVSTPKYEELKNNRLKILTFNYDVSLEKYLRIAIKNTYSESNISDDNARQIQEECFPVVHLYGSLLDDEDYEHEFNLNRLHACVQNIKIISESERDIETPEFQKAHQWISEAEKIVFARFGFDETNVERLQINEKFKGTEIFSSAYGFTDAVIGEKIYYPLHKLWQVDSSEPKNKMRFTDLWKIKMHPNSREDFLRFVSTKTLPQAFDDCGMLFD